MKEQQMEYDEKILRGAPGMLMLFVGILWYLQQLRRLSLDS